jgi:hypothetical protein
MLSMSSKDAAGGSGIPSLPRLGSGREGSGYTLPRQELLGQICVFVLLLLSPVTWDLGSSDH